MRRRYSYDDTAAADVVLDYLQRQKGTIKEEENHPLISIRTMMMLVYGMMGCR